MIVDANSTLNLTNQPSGITDAVAGSQYSIGGTFTAGLNNAFANLTDIEGGVNLIAQNDTITPIGGTLTLASGGQLTPRDGSTVTINGNADNSGSLLTGLGIGGNILNVTGSMTNQVGGSFFVWGTNDKTTVSGLNNLGTVLVNNGSTLQVNGDASNSGYLATGYYFLYPVGGGNTLTITGNLTNNCSAQP